MLTWQGVGGLTWPLCLWYNDSSGIRGEEMAYGPRLWELLFPEDKPPELPPVIGGLMGFGNRVRRAVKTDIENVQTLSPEKIADAIGEALNALPPTTPGIKAVKVAKESPLLGLLAKGMKWGEEPWFGPKRGMPGQPWETFGPDKMVRSMEHGWSGGQNWAKNLAEAGGYGPASIDPVGKIYYDKPDTRMLQDLLGWPDWLSHFKLNRRMSEPRSPN